MTNYKSRLKFTAMALLNQIYFMKEYQSTCIVNDRHRSYIHTTVKPRNMSAVLFPEQSSDN